MHPKIQFEAKIDYGISLVILEFYHISLAIYKKRFVFYRYNKQADFLFLVRQQEYFCYTQKQKCNLTF